MGRYVARRAACMFIGRWRATRPSLVDRAPIRSWLATNMRTCTMHDRRAHAHACMRRFLGTAKATLKLSKTYGSACVCQSWYVSGGSAGGSLRARRSIVHVAHRPMKHDEPCTSGKGAGLHGMRRRGRGVCRKSTKAIPSTSSSTRSSTTACSPLPPIGQRPRPSTTALPGSFGNSWRPSSLHSEAPPCLPSPRASGRSLRSRSASAGTALCTVCIGRPGARCFETKSRFPRTVTAVWQSGVVHVS